MLVQKYTLASEGPSFFYGKWLIRAWEWSASRSPYGAETEIIRLCDPWLSIITSCQCRDEALRIQQVLRIDQSWNAPQPGAGGSLNSG